MALVSFESILGPYFIVSICVKVAMNMYLFCYYNSVIQCNFTVSYLHVSLTSLPFRLVNFVLLIFFINFLRWT